MAIAENDAGQSYKVFPSTGLVIGFQYRGALQAIGENGIHHLATAGITGIQDRFKVFRNEIATGSILVYFTETGLAHFSDCPAHEIFNQSIALDHLFTRSCILQLEEQLALATTDRQRISYVEQFLLSQRRETKTDLLIAEAVRLLYESKGTLRIKALNQILCISQSPFEKRFRKLTGSSPKKFASIVRFNALLDQLPQSGSLSDLGYENGYFDQAHFIKDFRQYTGESPERFKRFS